MIGLYVKLKIKDGKQQEFETAAKELQELVRANEPGCNFYGFHKTDDPCVYVVLESYADQASLDAHGQTEYFKRVGGKFASVLGGAPEINRYEAI